MNQIAPRSVPAQRIGPARVGQPASNRNFSLSSAGGTGRNNGISTMGAAGTGTEGPRFAGGGGGSTRGGTEELERRRRKIDAWGESYVRSFFRVVKQGEERDARGMRLMD